MPGTKLKKSKIPNRVHFQWDYSAKLARQTSRLKGAKFFHKITLRFSSSDFKNLKCLNSDKPCAKSIVYSLEISAEYKDYYKVRKNSFSTVKLELSHRIKIDFKSKFWKQALLKMTNLDYVSPQTQNLSKIFSKRRPRKYRNLKHCAFPIDLSKYEEYLKLLSGFSRLHALKMLTFNIPSNDQTLISHFLKHIRYFPKLESLCLGCRISNAGNLDILTESIEQIKDLRHLEIASKNSMSNDLKSKFLTLMKTILSRHCFIQHFSVEFSLSPALHPDFIQLVKVLGKLENLYSLELRIENKQSKSSKLKNTETLEKENFSKLKYLELETSDGDLGEYLSRSILLNTKHLITCTLKNILMTVTYLPSSFFKSLKMRELHFYYTNLDFLPSLNLSIKRSHAFKKLSCFSIHLDSQDLNIENVGVDFKNIVDTLEDLQLLDTLILEFFFAIEISDKLFERLISKIMKMRLITFVKLDWRFSDETDCSSLEGIFNMKLLEIISIHLENGKLNKLAKDEIKRKMIDIRPLVSCSIRCENFKFNKNFILSPY